MTYRRVFSLAGASILLAVFSGVATGLSAQTVTGPPASAGTTVAQLEAALRERAKRLETSSGMQASFQKFLNSRHLSKESVNYSEFVGVRLLFEATRDAGLWNLHWAITDQPPNSDRIWLQWKEVRRTQTTPTARRNLP